MARLNLNKWGGNHKITFELNAYASNGNLAVEMVCWDDGYPEPWSRLTVNLDIKCESNCAFIDTNNNGDDIVFWLINNNLGGLTGRVGQSGFCTYPEFKFNMEEFKKYVEE